MIPQPPKVEREILLPLLEFKGYLTLVLHFRAWVYQED
jgi:hypothetical protein